MLLLYILLVFFLNIIKYHAVAEDELLAVTLIHRHGDRTPIKFYAKDPHKNSPQWPAPPGELTNTGKLQLYSLGKWFRNRYDGFLSPIYNVSEIYVRSSDTDRCIMSAASNLAGLYPPHGKDVWKDGFAWQPIPIHTVSPEEDDIAKVFNSCPKYSKILSESQQLPYYKQLQEKNKVFYEYLTNNTGEVVADLFDIFHLFDNIEIEKNYNFTLPNWTHEVYQKLKDLHEIAPKALTYTPELTRLFIGRLFHSILTQFEYFSGSHSDSVVPARIKKFMIYSLHDDQIFSVLNALKVPNLKPAPYGSSIIFELRKSVNGILFVQSFYKTDCARLQVINIQKCDAECSLKDFVEILEPIQITREDYKNKCLENS